MNTKVIKFPETLDQAFKRIDRKYEFELQKYNFEMKRARWFFAGTLTGSIISLSISFVCYYFFGFK